MRLRPVIASRDRASKDARLSTGYGGVEIQEIVWRSAFPWIAASAFGLLAMTDVTPLTARPAP